MTKVKVKIFGNTQVIQYTAGNNKRCSVVNLFKDAYVIKNIGEVNEKKISEIRYQTTKC